jgi:hypothetical protein
LSECDELLRMTSRHYHLMTEIWSLRQPQVAHR